jgi:hypothetical protein
MLEMRWSTNDEIRSHAYTSPSVVNYIFFGCAHHECDDCVGVLFNAFKFGIHVVCFFFGHELVNPISVICGHESSFFRYECRRCFLVVH